MTISSLDYSGTDELRHEIISFAKDYKRFNAANSVVFEGFRIAKWRGRDGETDKSQRERNGEEERPYLFCCGALMKVIDFRASFLTFVILIERGRRRKLF